MVFLGRATAGEKKETFREGLKELSVAEQWSLWFKAVWTVLGGLLICAIVIWVLSILAFPFGVFLWILIIVFCLRGIVNGLAKRNVPRGLGTTIAYFIMFAVLGVVTVLLFSPVFGFGGQFADIVANMPSYIQSVMDWLFGFADKYQTLLNNETIAGWVSTAGQTLIAWATGIARSGAQSVVDLGASAVSIMVKIAFALIMSFWILMELPAIGREVKRVIGPAYQDDAQMLYYSVTHVMHGYLKATIIQNALIGGLCMVLFLIANVPNAVAMGVITGLLSIIPIIGPWVAAGLAGLVGLVVSPWAGLAAFAGTIVIKQFVYTFIGPQILSDNVDVHPALTFIILLIGSSVGSFLGGVMGSLVGMFFSIPLAAVLKALFVYYFEKRTGRCIVAEDGFFFTGKPNKDGNPHPLEDAVDIHPESSKTKKESKKKNSAKISPDKTDIKETPETEKEIK